MTQDEQVTAEGDRICREKLSCSSSNNLKIICHIDQTLTRPTIIPISYVHFIKVSTSREHRTVSPVDFRIILKLM